MTMLHVVIKREAGRDVGINRDGSKENDRDHFELMDADAACLVANLYDGVPVAESRLVPGDYEIENESVE